MLIAHRGASTKRAENTLGAYRLAIELGADYVEGDLVVTRDGVLVARHERELSTTTDVGGRSEFAARKVAKPVNSTMVTGWFAEDFTLAELKTLRATIRHPAGQSWTYTLPPGTAIDETIPTVGEIIALAQSQRTSRGGAIGVYFELKDPAYYASIGLAPEPLLVSALRAANLSGSDAPVFVESFDAQSLRELHHRIDVPLIQLIGGVGGWADPATSPAALANIATYARGIGVEYPRLSKPISGPITAAGDTTAPPLKLSARMLDRTLLDDAHRVGLEVHLYTFSDAALDDAVIARYRAYFDAGVDGVFTDNPDFARRGLP